MKSQLFSPKFAISGFLVFLAGVLGDRGINDLLDNSRDPSISTILIIAAALLAAIFAIFVVRSIKTYTLTRYIEAKSFRKEETKALIALVSTYNWKDNDSAAIKFEDLKESINNCKLPNGFDFSKTSLGPIVWAIEQATNLKSVWLISTKQPEKSPLAQDATKASINCSELIARYFIDVKNLDLEIHYDTGWAIDNPHDSKAPTDIRDLVLKAQDQALEKFEPREIVTDVTGGVKGMHIGAILACVRPDMNLQYAVTNNKQIYSSQYSFEIEISHE